MAEYSVLVGNIGQVHRGNKKREAETIYRHYIRQSKSNTARAGNEPVTLFKDSEIIAEYFGKLDEYVD